MHKVVSYIPPLPINRVVKLFAIYNILHNIFMEKEKYNIQQICGAITKFFCNIIFKHQDYYITLV